MFRFFTRKLVLALTVAIVALSTAPTLTLTLAQEGTCDDATPCQNGGTCHFDDVRLVNYCHCPTGTAGKLCHGTNCPLTCRNGGSCRHPEDGEGDPLDFFCECVGGFGGDSCELGPGEDAGESDEQADGDTSEVEARSNGSTKSKSGMSPGGKFAVSIFVIAAVGMLAFLVVKRRPGQRNTQSVVDKNAAIHEAETYEDTVADDMEKNAFDAAQSTAESASENTASMEDLEDYSN